MILGPVSLLDCVFFVLFLAPQLLIQAGLFRTAIAAVQALPFLIFQLPVQLVWERYLTSTANQSGFARNATLFEDLIVRCVRYAFQYIPANVGRIFFDKRVARPFMRWRMLRHGYIWSPVYWKEEVYGEGSESFRGVWIKHKPKQRPDIVIYYIHGGGFSMGSAFFYLEFLLAWHHLLVEAGYHNPAIFALDYTLVPDAIYPRQLHQALGGYQKVLDTVKDASKICVSGDSAGGALILSLLQELGSQSSKYKAAKKKGELVVNGGLSEPSPPSLPLPQLATLISPWVTLMTHLHRDSSVDYLDRQSLWKYAHEYAGGAMIHQHPASPGSCDDERIWQAASPAQGYYVIYGESEVFAADIDDFLERQESMDIDVASLRIKNGVHAWPVASLFLSSAKERRLEGLRILVREMRRRMMVVAGVVENGRRKKVSD